MIAGVSLLLFVFCAALQEDRATLELLEKLEDSDPKVRVEARGKFLEAGERALPTAQSFRRRLSDPEAAFRLDVLIGLLTPAAGAGGLEDLKKSYGSRGREGRDEVLRLLATRGAAAALLEIGSTEADPGLRRRIVAALRVIRSPETTPLFLDCLKEEDRPLRSEALVALAESGKVTVAQMKAAIGDRALGPAVVRSLGALDEKEIRELQPLLLKSESPVLRMAALDRGVEAKDLLTLAAQDRDRIVRRKALDLLLSMRTGAAAEARAHLTTANNVADRARFLEAVDRTGSLLPIPVWIERLRALESQIHEPNRENQAREVEDAVAMLGRTALLLKSTQCLPFPLSAGTITPRLEPEDTRDEMQEFRWVCDGAWGKNQSWTHRRGQALILDLGESRAVHSLVALKNGGFPLLSVSEDDRTFERAVIFGMGSFQEHVVVDARGRYLKIDPDKGNRGAPDEATIREIFVYTIRGDRIRSAWEAWWKALEPRLAGYEELRADLMAVREQIPQDPAGAAQKAEALIKKDPASYLAHEVLLEASLRIGDSETAAAEGVKALALAPEAVGIHGRIAESHLQKGRWKPALEEAGATLAEAPGDPDARFAAARACAGLGDKENALHHLLLAVLSGYSDVKRLQEEPQLGPIRSDPRYSEIVALLTGGR